MTENKLILIVDDNPRVLLLLRASLEKLGQRYSVVVAQDGAEALDLFRNSDFDLVITDVKMPGIGGIELAEAIRELDTETAIIFITAYRSNDLKAECERLNIYRCLDKPMRIGEIRRAALAALGNSLEHIG